MHPVADRPRLLQIAPASWGDLQRGANEAPAPRNEAPRSATEPPPNRPRTAKNLVRREFQICASSEFVRDLPSGGVAEGFSALSRCVIQMTRCRIHRTLKSLYNKTFKIKSPLEDNTAFPSLGEGIW